METSAKINFSFKKNQYRRNNKKKNYQNEIVVERLLHGAAGITNNTSHGDGTLLYVGFCHVRRR